jgi:hypothetical protein
MKNLFSVQIITMLNGKQYYMYNGYTYYQESRKRNDKRWRCTGSCKAYLIVTIVENDILVTAVHDHGHPPPRFHRMASGAYIKV